MKKLPWIIVLLLSVVCVAVWFRPRTLPPTEVRTETRVRTVVKIDTLLISSPLPPAFFFVTKDTFHIGDTVVNREQAVYVDSMYRAWVSGYRPRLDSIEIYPRTITNTVTNDIYHTIAVKDKRRFGLGIQAGYGYPGGIYVGIGISYNLFTW